MSEVNKQIKMKHQTYVHIHCEIPIQQITKIVATLSINLIEKEAQCTSPEHLASCIEPGLVIYFTYDNTHVSVLFSQMGREVGGRVRMGNTCTPMADSCECMTKTATIL